MIVGRRPGVEARWAWRALQPFDVRARRRQGRRNGPAAGAKDVVCDRRSRASFRRIRRRRLDLRIGGLGLCRGGSHHPRGHALRMASKPLQAAEPASGAQGRHDHQRHGQHAQCLPLAIHRTLAAERAEGVRWALRVVLACLHLGRQRPEPAACPRGLLAAAHLPGALAGRAACREAGGGGGAAAGAPRPEEPLRFADGGDAVLIVLGVAPDPSSRAVGAGTTAIGRASAQKVEGASASIVRQDDALQAPRIDQGLQIPRQPEAQARGPARQSPPAFHDGTLGSIRAEGNIV
mmetsp:Transcript_134796/g.430770  ORF Transcript_134796/g.430770 Transcript_134796/m.430770 type:complete len:292 (-) Transcript_134796:300-1175(-)